MINGRGFIVVALFTLAFVSLAFAQDHSGHRPQDMAIHQKFYQHWNMPKNRSVSFCHDEDCKPAEAYKVGDDWYARQEGDTGEFTKVPKDTVDIGLPDSPDNPDGRSHMCGRRYGFNTGEFTVFCFIAGSGS